MSDFCYKNKDDDECPRMDKRHCSGCEDDFYNHRQTPGFDGGRECWSLKTAKLCMRKRVSIHQRPPWLNAPEQLPSCYHQKGFIFVAGDQER